MDISSLAAKQKRINDWRSFTESEVASSQLRTTILEKLSSFQAVLAECWAGGSITPEQRTKILSLERELEQLNEEARFISRGGGYVRNGSARS